MSCRAARRAKSAAVRPSWFLMVGLVAQALQRRQPNRGKW